MHRRFRPFLPLRAQVTASFEQFKRPRIRLPRAALVGYHDAPLSGVYARTHGVASARRTRTPDSPPNSPVFRPARRAAVRAGSTIHLKDSG